MLKKFTLTELLIIIAIIGILCTLLMPSLSNARKRSLQVVCMNNQKQIYTAVIGYQMDNNFFAPYDDQPANVRWHQRLISEYLPQSSESFMSSDILECPEAEKIDAKWQSGIAINAYASGAPDIGNWYTPVPLLHFLENEAMILMDSFDNWCRIRNGYMAEDKMLNSAENIRIARHLLKANVTYLDGTIKSREPSHLLSKTSAFSTFWSTKGL